MALTWPAKDPSEVVDYEINWAARLVEDTIATSNVTLVTAAGLTIVSQANTDDAVTVWFSGGTAGLTATLRNVITTAGGRTMDELIKLPIADDNEIPPLVSLDEAKAHLKLEVGTVGEDDDLIETYIEAATSHLDGPSGYLGRSLRPQTVEAVLDAFTTDPIRLPYGPILGDIVVTYTDTNGAEQTVADTVYALVKGPALRLAYGESWPTAQVTPDAVRITYRAGYDGNLPGAIKAAILLMVGDLNSNREANSVQAGSLIINPTVEALLAPFRAWSV